MKKNLTEKFGIDFQILRILSFQKNSTKKEKEKEKEKDEEKKNKGRRKKKGKNIQVFFV